MKIRLSVLTILSVASLTTGSQAETHEVRIPADKGKITFFDVTPAAARWLSLPTISLVADVNAFAHSRFVAGLNVAMAGGCDLEVCDDAVVVRVDPEKLPKDSTEARKAARTFTATVAPDATAAQSRTFGLLLPQRVDPHRRMIVLVHGLDSDRAKWQSMAKLLRDEGYQVGWFSYPSDQPIADSTKFATEQFLVMRRAYPDMPVDIIAHSMGSLVMRGYVEGNDYTGGISRLILIAPPNHGSGWARARLLLEFREHFDLWRHEPDWSPSWMITDGLGEAGDDLMPDSAFIAALNAKPRRDGVNYTIIAGDRNLFRRVTGNVVESTTNIVPRRAQSWPGFRQAIAKIDRLGEGIKNHDASSDGTVSLSSAHLDGVTDEVIVHGDHNSLFQPIDNDKPAAWDVIRDRLSDCH